METIFKVIELVGTSTEGYEKAIDNAIARAGMTLKGLEFFDVADLLCLLTWIRDVEGIEGITLSGGEPLQQCAAVATLLHRVRKETDLSVVVFTGFGWEHVANTPSLLEVARLADIVIAGPYRKRQRLERGFRGSTNQTIHLMTDRYSLADIERVPDVEVVVGDGAVIETGIVVPGT